jgi:hypothetical protein
VHGAQPSQTSKGVGGLRLLVLVAWEGHR